MSTTDWIIIASIFGIVVILVLVASYCRVQRRKRINEILLDNYNQQNPAIPNVQSNYVVAPQQQSGPGTVVYATAI